MSESNSVRLQTSREWLRARRQGTSIEGYSIAHSADVSSIDPPSAPLQGDMGVDPLKHEGGDDQAAARPQNPANLHSFSSATFDGAADERRQRRRLYEAEAEIINAGLSGRGVDRFRRGSDFRAPPRNNLDRNFVARIWFVAKMIEQKTWASRKKGKHGGEIGAVGLEVLRTLLYVIKKVDGRLYPSLEVIAKLSRKSKQAIFTAIKVLERMGFITIHRRVKRIKTPFGVRVVQDSNAYEFHLPISGLGALAMAVFCPRSESTKLDAYQHKHENREEIACGIAEKKLCREEVDRWWLAQPFQTGNGGLR